MISIWIITAVLFSLFVILFLVRVFKNKHALGDLADSAARQAFNFKEFLKMAYPAALIYAVFYAIFILLCRFEVFGSVEEDMNAATWIPGLLVLYVVIKMQFRLWEQ